MASTTNRRGAGAVRLSFDLLWSVWIGIAASDVVAARIAEHLFQWEQVGAFVDHAAGQPKFTVRTSVQFVTRSQRNTFKQFEKQRQVERAVTPTRQQGTTDLRLIDDDDEIHSAVAVEIVGRKVLGPTCDRDIQILAPNVPRPLFNWTAAARAPLPARSRLPSPLKSATT